MVMIVILLMPLLVFSSCNRDVHEITEDDFKLTVTMERTILNRHEEPVIYAKLKNVSEQSIRVTVRSFPENQLFNGDIPTARYLISITAREPFWVRTINLRAGEYVKERVFLWSAGFNTGEHEALVNASFYIRYWGTNQQRISLNAGPVNFAVS